MKKILAFLVLSIALISCADSKTFTTPSGEVIHAKPYGWANYEEKKDDRVVYQACVGNIVWSIILVETVVAPVLFTGYSLYEPVKLKEPK